jgi:hypothetical protein
VHRKQRLPSADIVQEERECVADRDAATRLKRDGISPDPRPGMAGLVTGRGVGAPHLGEPQPWEVM